MALSRPRRIRRSGEFAAVREKGASWPGRYFILATLPLDAGGETRFGFTVTRRVGNAVCRNRIRRRLTTVIDRLRGRMAPGFLVVTIPRVGAAKAEFAAIEAEWTRLARRAGILVPANPPAS